MPEGNYTTIHIIYAHQEQLVNIVLKQVSAINIHQSAGFTGDPLNCRMGKTNPCSNSCKINAQFDHFLPCPLSIQW